VLLQCLECGKIGERLTIRLLETPERLPGSTYRRTVGAKLTRLKAAKERL